MATKISVFVLHWHSLSKLCQWGAFYKHSILHPWFNQGRWLEWPSMYPKNHDCITCINSFIAYHKNDLEVLTVTTVCAVSKSDSRIERYCMIKFTRLACIVWGEADQVWLIEWIYVIGGVFFLKWDLLHGITTNKPIIFKDYG